ncbi:MAG: ATP phosphoribosyltransferase regulatory subunit [Synergistaceae bacterium]|nr:ATP phosphoribosyltransferase regulatory subunit [Synergistaceae bacterium]
MYRKLKDIFNSHGLKHLRLAPFDDYDFYSDKKDFLDSHNKSILTFTDLNGRLMALRPDVTLSILHHPRPGKWHYLEDVFRPDENENSLSFRKFQQAGIEFLGDFCDSDVRQVIDIALACLEKLADGKNFMLDIADTGLVADILRKRKGKSEKHEKESEILSCLAGRNYHGLKELDAPDELLELLNTNSLPSKYSLSVSRHLKVDYSAVNNLNYYNGLTFKGYIETIPYCVLSGGQYDGILRAMNSSIKNGMGFAVYLDRIGVDFDDD